MKRHSRNPFTALAVTPQSVHLEMQEENEKIELIIRRHVITNLQWLAIAALFSVAPFIFFSDYGREVLFTQHLLNVMSAKGQIFFVVMWYVILLLYMLQNAMLWFFNVLVVTNNRIIDLDVTWPFHRKITEAQLKQVQDVSFSQGGLFANLLDLGDIHVQTAGIKQDIEIIRVPNPAFIHDKITDLVQLSMHI